MSSTKGVLLMAYGTPRGLDEVEAFYTHIRGGRPPTPELLANLRARYQAVGGETPLLEVTRQQAEALERRLGAGHRVIVGMKHWHPYIEQAVSEMAEAGVEHAAALALAPHYSAMSVGAYLHAIDEAQTKLRTEIQFERVESWHLQPHYLEAVADRTRKQLDGFSAEVVIFTAHSLPKRILEMGDPYVDQLQATSQALAEILRLSNWTFSFQSAGATGDSWLGPDILETINRLGEEGVKRALVAPIGFISDHLEILYDLDILAKQHAAARGVELRRTESLNASPGLIEALAEVVKERLD